MLTDNALTVEQMDAALQKQIRDIESSPSYKAMMDSYWLAATPKILVDPAMPGTEMEIRSGYSTARVVNMAPALPNPCFRCYTGDFETEHTCGK